MGVPSELPDPELIFHAAQHRIAELGMTSKRQTEA
jgi:hypothetical protein